MAEVNEALTRKMADLARLELSDEEVRVFTGQLAGILAYVEELAQLDLRAPDGDEVSPLTHPLDLETPMREDQAFPFPVDDQGRPKTLGPAPETLDGGFKVPQVI